MRRELQEDEIAIVTAIMGDLLKFVETKLFELPLQDPSEELCILLSREAKLAYGVLVGFHPDLKAAMKKCGFDDKVTIEAMKRNKLCLPDVVATRNEMKKADIAA